MIVFRPSTGARAKLSGRALVAPKLDNLFLERIMLFVQLTGIISQYVDQERPCTAVELAVVLVDRDKRSAIALTSAISQERLLFMLHLSELGHTAFRRCFSPLSAPR